MSYPLISVIIPVYKVEEYLYECVDSVLAQTYTNLEIILVNDGSPDNCGAICDNYATQDNRIKVIHKENGGLSDARNAGLNVCNGEYIAFVDSDDSILPNFIEVLYSNALKYDAEISVVGSFRNPQESDKSCNKPDVFVYKNYLDFLNDDSIGDKIEVWRKLYKRNIWEDLRFPFGKKSEDTFVFPYIVYQRKIIYIDCKLYYYRLNPKSIMETLDDKGATDANEAFFRSINFFKEHQPDFVDQVMKEQIGFNYSYYLRRKFYNDVCRRFLVNNINLVFKFYPLRTSIKLYTIMFVRRILGKE